MKKIKKEKTIVDKVETIESDDTQEKNKNKSFNIIEVIVIMIITLLFGAFVGSSVTYFREKNGLLTGNKYLKELISTYYDVANNYYGDINSEELLESGIKGMIDYLNDPYSNYLSPSTSAKLNENLEGKYVGLGAEVIQNDDNNLVIKKIYEGSPAEKSGLKLDDVIYKVDDTLVNTLTLEEVTSIIKGKEGTTSLLGVKRGSEELQLKFVREKVDIYSVTGEVIEKDNKKLGLIKISVFAKNSYEQFEKTYNNLFKEGISSLIIDVRDNNGGYLSVVKDISEMFLNKNDTVFIVEDNDGKVVQKASKKAIIKIPTVVLINEGSASASEVLASTLNENLKFELIGSKTYGKGTVQKTKELTSGAIIKYTIQKWLTPSCKNIDGIGIEPTIEIAQSKEYYKNPTKENDSQLQKAIDTLLDK